MYDVSLLLWQEKSLSHSGGAQEQVLLLPGTGFRASPCGGAGLNQWCVAAFPAPKMAVESVITWHLLCSGSHWQRCLSSSEGVGQSGDPLSGYQLISSGSQGLLSGEQ